MGLSRLLAGHARKLPNFHLAMQAEARLLISENGRVTGLVAKTAGDDLEVRAALVVGADGRHSTIRAQAGLRPQDFGATMDVLWLRVPRLSRDPPDLFGQIDAGRMRVMIARGDYWQCALPVPKGSGEAARCGRRCSACRPGWAIASRS